MTPEEIERASDGRYEVQSVIGQGGMGTVFLAINRELGSRVAIKVLTGDIIFNEARMARFRREAALSAQLSHPNIVPVFELKSVDRAAYLVMPFIDGVSLEQHLRENGPLARPELDTMLDQVGSALAYAHSRHVIHRDVKPANILLESDSGRWLLTDFGVAHVAGDGITQLTDSDATIGTLSYMAPEQLGSAREVDERADLFALSMVACESLLGRHPEREGPYETAKMLTESVSGINSEWARTLTWPLASARDERPPNVPTWLDRLKKKRRRPRQKLAAAVIGTMGLAGALTWGLRLGGDSAAETTPVIAVFPFDVTGDVAALGDANSVLTRGFTLQIQTLPGLQTLNEEAVRASLQDRYGAAVRGTDTLLQIARNINATRAVVGRADISNDLLNVRVEVFDTETEALIDNIDVEKPLDSLHSVVSEAVIGVFATPLAASFSGITSPSLPVGLPAIAAYIRGDLALRRGTLEDAVSHFDRVIDADPSFAPVYLRRALALSYLARPSEAATAIRPAVDLANQHRDRLDDVSQRLLDAISVLVYEGDLRRADSQLRNIRGDNPDAVDVWFLLGALQARFPELMGATLIEARQNLREVLTRDPSYGLAYAVLIQVAALLGQNEEARSAIRGYLSLDSTSQRAAAARLADSVLFRQSAFVQIVQSFPSRSPLVLENIAQAAGDFDPPGGARPFVVGAIDALLRIATTDAERAVAGRMRIATHFGSGEFENAVDFVTEAQTRGVPVAEIDRWIVLSDVMELAPLASATRVRSAVANLRQTDDDPVTSRWLVARWTRLNDTASVASADRALQTAKMAAAPDTIDAWAFQLDLAAHDAMTVDPAQALELWERATTRHALDRVAFGLVSSRWPIYLDRIRTVANSGDFEATNQLVRHFESMTGFTDQMAWFPAFMTLADLAQTAADSVRARHVVGGILRNIIDPRVQLADSLRAAWGLGRPNP